MRVFIGMETSGALRRRFRAIGHDVVSADTLPAEDDGIGHRVGDVFAVLNTLKKDGWWPDLAIFHPTCTYLTNSAAWAYGDGPYHQKVKPGTLVGALRREARECAVADFMRIVSLPIERMAIENPIGCMSTRYRPADQIIQPNWFGEDASKATCLWLFGLEPLEPTDLVLPRLVNGRPRWANQTDSGQNRLSPGDNRWKDRSRTYGGIAEAMVARWGSVDPSTNGNVSGREQAPGRRKQEMGSEIINRAGTELSEEYYDSLIGGIADSRSQTVIAGGKPLMRLLKSGTWVFGQTNEPVQIGSTWAINPESIQHGFSCWTNNPDPKAKNELLGEVMVKISAKKPMKPDPIHGNEFNEQRSWDMMCVLGDDDGVEVHYKVSSVGGMRAADNFFAALIAQAMAEKARTPNSAERHVVAVVQLKSSPYDHNKWGQIFNPIFDIVAWRTMDGTSEMPVGGGRAAAQIAPSPKPAARPAKAPIQPAQAQPAQAQPAPVEATAQPHVSTQRPGAAPRRQRPESRA